MFRSNHCRTNESWGKTMLFKQLLVFLWVSYLRNKYPPTAERPIFSPNREPTCCFKCRHNSFSSMGKLANSLIRETHQFNTHTTSLSITFRRKKSRIHTIQSISWRPEQNHPSLSIRDTPRTPLLQSPFQDSARLPPQETHSPS